MSTPTSPFDRRLFVKASAATAASALLLARLGAQPRAEREARAQKADPIKVGLLGCGGRGTGAAENALNGDAGVVITALGDILPDRLESCHTYLTENFADRVKVDPAHRFVGFDALDKILNSGIDVILFATPPHFRPMQIKAAVEKGLHIFAEKPMAVDGPGIRMVVEAAAAAKAKKLSLVSGFCWRSSKPERAAYERVHAGDIGALRAVYATYNGSPNSFVEKKPGMSAMEWQVRNWFHYLWLGGDHIVEQACHSIDKINWAFDNEPPIQCWAVGGRQQRTKDHPGNIYDHFAVTYEYKDDRRAFLQARQWENVPSDNTDWIYGEKGICRVNGWGPEHWIRGEKNWRYEGPKESVGAMYDHEHVELFAGIRAGKPRWDGDWMVTSTLMAIMGRMAAYTGQTIKFADAMNSQERLGPTDYALGELETTAVPIPGRTKFV